MRPVNTHAMVRTQLTSVQNVSWRDASGNHQSHQIARSIDSWSYVGHWWANEVRREYQLLESVDGFWLEVYCEGDRWWIARTNG
jgi:hypothetical protein